MPFGIQRFNRLQFVGGQQIAPGFVNSDLRCNRLGGVNVIASEHHGLDAQIMQLMDRFAAGFLHRIGYGKQRQWAGLVEQQHHRFALFFQGEQLLLQRRRAQAQVFNQTMVTQMVELTVDLATHPAPAQRFEVIHNEWGELFIHSRIGDGPRYRVIGSTGQRSGNRRS
ncbi:hypothetical protein D3C86_1577960 [compost metagenome]